MKIYVTKHAVKTSDIVELETEKLNSLRFGDYGSVSFVTPQGEFVSYTADEYYNSSYDAVKAVASKRLKLIQKYAARIERLKSFD